MIEHHKKAESILFGQIKCAVILAGPLNLAGENITKTSKSRWTGSSYDQLKELGRSSNAGEPIIEAEVFKAAGISCKAIPYQIGDRTIEIVENPLDVLLY